MRSSPRRYEEARSGDVPELDFGKLVEFEGRTRFTLHIILCAMTKRAIKKRVGVSEVSKYWMK